MATVAPPASAAPPPYHFPRHGWRAAIPAAFAVGTFGLFAYRVPDGIWVAIPGLCLLLFLCAALHGGLVVSRSGIAWYTVRPGWRYRAIPWRAVRDVDRPLFGLPRLIRLTVERGRYEPWAGGTPDPDREMAVEIRPTAYAGGDAIWDAIHQFWPPREHADVAPAVRTVRSGR